MSYNKAIEHGKEHRKPYHGSKVFDPSCRNNCGCDWCLANRRYRTNREEERTEQALEEYNNIDKN